LEPTILTRHPGPRAAAIRDLEAGDQEATSRLSAQRRLGRDDGYEGLNALTCFNRCQTASRASSTS
jgi:hypothetical protein